MQCSLCEQNSAELFFSDKRNQWEYFECQNCFLVFRDSKTFLSEKEEKNRYQTHNNSIEDEGYVRFLNPVVDLLLKHLKPGAKGLDFGCGPGPILQILFKRQDFEVVNYDPYFEKTPQALLQRYDFITCTEVFEHFYEPKKEMNLFSGLIKDQGYLVIMSEFLKNKEDFANWWYRADNTHVSFLSEKTLHWLSLNWGYKVLFCDGRISLLQKNKST